MAIMEAGVYGPREILPQSMHEGLTRITFGVGPSSHAGRAKLGFEHSEAGIWLPHASLATKDLSDLQSRMSLAKAHNYFMVSFPQLKEDRKAVKAIELADSGCWVSDDFSLGSLYPYSTDNHVTLENDSQLEERRLCDTPDCVYHRHYDATSSVPSGRRELLYPNLRYFKDIGNAIVTAWGDTLPPVTTSREALRTMQLQCAPHVQDSLLTMGGIAKISLIPTTGCWHTASYNMTPIGENAPKGWQYDGYGRLGLPKQVGKMLGLTGSQMLGHRRTWAVAGNHLDRSGQYVLNHMCGYRPCCNPLHLEQITHKKNSEHGKIMEAAVQAMENPGQEDVAVDRMIALSRGLIGTTERSILNFWG